MEKRIGKAHESVDAAGVAGLVAAVRGGVVGAQFQRQRLDQQSAETAHRPVAAIVNHSSVLPDAKKKGGIKKKHQKKKEGASVTRVHRNFFSFFLIEKSMKIVFYRRSRPSKPTWQVVHQNETRFGNGCHRLLLQHTEPIRADCFFVVVDFQSRSATVVWTKKKRSTIGNKAAVIIG